MCFRKQLLPEGLSAGGIMLAIAEVGKTQSSEAEVKMDFFQEPPK
jgi:hypothetical protein